MSFSAAQIQFLQRLADEKPAQRRAGDTARFFCEHFSLGTSVGHSVEYGQEHHRLAEALLRTHDLPVNSMGQDASRADVAVYGGLSEKSLSAAPHSKSVALKFLGPCMVDGQALVTPAGSYMVVTPAFASRIACDRLMLVENLETFRNLEAYRWLDYEGLAVMAVFRGDPSLPLQDALEVMRGRTESIWVFADFDPAGLAIANALPHARLEKLVLPPVRWLRQAADSARGRQLFAEQVDGCSQALEQSAHQDVKAWWGVMRSWRSAVTQERMLSAHPAAGVLKA